MTFYRRYFSRALKVTEINGNFSKLLLYADNFQVAGIYTSGKHGQRETRNFMITYLQFLQSYLYTFKVTTPRNRILLEKLIVAHLIKRFPEGK
jgi:hypothetical protein